MKPTIRQRLLGFLGSAVKGLRWISIFSLGKIGSRIGVTFRIPECRHLGPYLCYIQVVKSAGRTPNVRISARAHGMLRKLAEEAEESMQAILERAIERYRREEFLRAANQDFEALQRNRKAWREELKQRKIWERTLADGLDKQ